jgi:ABC-type multidrug transport system ATPase subunit
MLSIRGLVKVYPGQPAALNGIDLDIGNGLFGLLGPNGAGKTTLMKILAGLLEPTAGAVALDGVDILARPEYVHERLGYLPQDFGFLPQLSGQAMLEVLLRLKGLRPAGGIAALAAQLLEQVNLGAAAGKRIQGYSGGMVQRLGIAQALAGDPRLVIVDEPTTGLDPEERQRFYRLLADLARDRIVLLSTHLVEDVAVLCPRFAVLGQGRLLAVTTPREALAELQGDLYEGLVPDREALERLKAEACVTQAVRRDGATWVRLHQRSGAVPDGFVPAAPNLEDAYMVLMQAGPGLAAVR